MRRGCDVIAASFLLLLFGVMKGMMCYKLVFSFFMGILMLAYEPAQGQLVETDSTLTINQDFDFKKEGETFYLMPTFEGICYKRGYRYPYAYYRGELVGKIPFMYYERVYSAYKKVRFSLVDLDSTFTVYFLGSITEKYYSLSVSRNSETMLLTFYKFGGEVCEKKILPKSAFTHVLVEDYIRSSKPNYDEYSRLTLFKK